MLCNLKSPQRRPRSRLRLRLLEATLEAAVSVQHAVGGDEITKDLESKLGTATKASEDDRPLADKLANYRGYMSMHRKCGYRRLRNIVRSWQLDEARRACRPRRPRPTLLARELTPRPSVEM